MKLNKKQKRTATIASMAALLAVVLGMGGSTFAKYIETHNVETGQATVAKWGFVVTTNVNNLFGAEYGRADANDAYATIANKDGKISVSGQDARVAPGTSGYMTITVNGISEVTSKLTIDMTDYTDVYVKEGIAEVYNPIKWTLKEGDNTVFSKVNTAKIDAELASYKILLDAEQSISKTFTLTWEWDFLETEEANKYDTILGHWADDPATEPDYECSTELSADFAITLEQTKTNS